MKQDLAVFYGRNRPDYYFTEGMPILLTTLLPFALAGTVQAFRSTRHIQFKTGGSKAAEANRHSTQIYSRLSFLALATTALVYILALSLISHKEVRFLHPVLPIFLLLSVRPISVSFNNYGTLSTGRKILLGTLMSTSLIVTGYTSYYHNRGVIPVLSYLRSQFSALNAETLVLRSASRPSVFTSITSATKSTDSSQAANVVPLTAAFFMPCHSTPWRSHLVFPEIRAWALTCEPPLHLAARSQEREKYLDEADVFYQDPAAWIKAEMAPLPSSEAEENTAVALNAWHEAGMSKSNGWDLTRNGANAIARDELGRRRWPRYVAFFEHLESTMKMVLQHSIYQECWRSGNTDWHDDWRRKGDVIVWCRRTPQLAEKCRRI